MRKTIAGACLCLALVGATACRGAAAQGAAQGGEAATAGGSGLDRPQPGHLIADQIRIVLGARGYSNLGPMEREGDTVLIPEAKRYGEATGPLRLDARTGQVRDEKPLTEAQAHALLRDRGFSDIRETWRDGDLILATAQRGSSRVDLKVDARSGAVSQR